MTLFEKAIQFAVEAHSGQVRKHGNSPYILHPLEAATIVATMSTDEELLAAMVLHDTVEDTDATPEQIEKLFGKRVAALVSSETENKRQDLPPEQTWYIRKQETLKNLQQTDDTDVKMLWLGDKLSNLRSFYRSWRVCGHELWKSFNQHDPGMHAWYYRSIGEALKELSEYDAWKEYQHLVSVMFEGV